METLTPHLPAGRWQSQALSPGSQAPEASPSLPGCPACRTKGLAGSVLW